MSVEATINFAVPESHPTAEPYTFATVVATQKPLHIAPHLVQLSDLRPRIGKIDFDTEGFAAEKVPAVLSGDGWEDRYVLATCEWLRTYLGAKRVLSYNYQVRRRIPPESADFPKDFDPERLQPATVAHVDSSRERGFTRTREVLGFSPGEAEGKRLAVINVWRPTAGRVVDSPLAVCDTRTTSEDDITLTTDVYGPGSFIAFSDRQKWAYLKDQMPDEVLLVRCFDSTKGPSQCGVTPHSAFIDEERIKSEPFEYRQSIEVRCVVEY